jgi:hypothetical protein
MTYSSPPGVTITVTASASVPTESAVITPNLACPENNNTVYTATNGGKFAIICNENFPFNDLEKLNNTSSLNQCIEHCAYFNRLKPSIPCVGVVLTVFESLCWIKSAIGSGLDTNDSWSAMLVQ